LWNSLMPAVREYSYKIQEFPFRYPWLRCTCGFLLEMAAHSYRRNDLPVSVGGVSVRDKAKFKDYEEKAKSLIDEFKTWAQNHKSTMSVSDSFGGISSPYRCSRY